VDFYYHDIVQKFWDLYDVKPLVIRAPGRINLIGEHTDYNDGFVMPAAIDKEITFAIAPSEDETSTIYAMAYNEFYTADLDNPQPVEAPKWANYLLGVLRQFVDKEYSLKPFKCVFGGNIPVGAGLSSSAALETGFAFALNELNDLKVDRESMIKMAQWSEHNFVGVKCGIMDQFASMMGEDGKVIVLDCRSLEYEYSPLQLTDYSIVLCNTGVKHSLVDSEYNTRRSECEQGVKLLKPFYPGIKSLRDVAQGMLDEHRGIFPGKVYQRCAYVVQEIKRVQDASKDLQHGNLTAFGQKMFETHHGLSSMYEVSCPELDFLVDHAKNASGVLGARMMGGGFGGCTINIIHQKNIESFIASATDAYRKAFNLELIAYIVHVKSGTGFMNEPAESIVG
jgi:galactokinase